MALAAGTVIDRYTILGPVGRGGMAVVYRARHEQLGSWHAIKVLNVAHSDIKARLVQEGRIQATLKHPNIVAVTDIVEVSGSPALVMEWVDGCSMDRLLSAGKLDTAQADELLRGLCAGLAEAHDRGLVHRDLKPANVLLELRGTKVVPKVADFGLAKILEADGSGSGPATRSGVTMGTPNYMAPEQFRNSRDVDARADVFALGALMYEVVTGKRCFPGDDLVALISMVTEERYQRLADEVPDIGASRRKAIEGALRADRYERLASVDAFRAAWFDGVTPEVADWSKVVPLVESLRPVTSMPPTQVAGPHSPLTWSDDAGGLTRPHSGSESLGTPAVPVLRAPDVAPVASGSGASAPPSGPSSATTPAPGMSKGTVALLICGAVVVALLAGMGLKQVITNNLSSTLAIVEDRSGLMSAFQARKADPSMKEGREKLKKWLEGRDSDLLVGLAAVDRVGDDDGTATALNLRLKSTLQSLPKVRLVVLDPADGFGDEDHNAMANAGREGGVDQVVHGSFVKAGTFFILNLEWIDVEHGTVKATAYREAHDLEELMGVLDVMLYDLFMGGQRPADKAVVMAMMEERTPELMGCYDELRGRAPEVGGQIELAFRVRPSGRITDVWYPNGTLGDEAFGTCLTGLMKGMLFPAGLDQEVSWPITFGTAPPPAPANDARAGG